MRGAVARDDTVSHRAATARLQCKYEGLGALLL